MLRPVLSKDGSIQSSFPDEQEEALKHHISRRIVKMKKTAVLLIVALLVPILCACGGCSHVWAPATCTAPQYCQKCGVSNGSALGHDWVQASPGMKTCARCGITQVTDSAASSSVAPAQAPEVVQAPATTQNDSSVPPCPTLSELEDKKYNGGVRTKTKEGVTLQLPWEDEMLDEPFRATVDSGTKHGSIYVMPKPLSGNGNLGRIDNGTKVWIVAKTAFYYFFYADNGQMGWNSPSNFRVD